MISIVVERVPPGSEQGCYLARLRDEDGLPLDEISIGYDPRGEVRYHVVYRHRMTQSDLADLEWDVFRGREPRAISRAREQHFRLYRQVGRHLYLYIPE